LIVLPTLLNLILLSLTLSNTLMPASLRIVRTHLRLGSMAKKNITTLTNIKYVLSLTRNLFKHSRIHQWGTPKMMMYYDL
jgi:hypothetical protein